LPARARRGPRAAAERRRAAPAQRLRKAQLLSRSGSSLKLFAAFGARVYLQPPGKPAQVRLRA
jgi:hypothetical protein